MSIKDNQNNSKFSSVALKKFEREDAAVNEAVINKYSGEKNKEAKNDKRVRLTKYFIAIVLLGSLAGLFTTDRALDEIASLVITFFILAIIIYIGFFVLRNDPVGSLAFSLMSLYVWVAFPFKLIVAVNYPEVLWVSRMLFEPRVVGDEIAESFLTVFPALAFLLLGLFVFHRHKNIHGSCLIAKVYHTRFIAVITFLMCLRVFNQVVLDIGMPGVKPTVLPIPYLTGVLELLSRPVLFAVVNLYFYYVIRLNDRKIMWLSILFLLINVILGLRVGYKSELVLQGLLLIYYSFDVYHYLSKTSRKFMVTITVSMIVIIVLIYPLVNHYRNSILSGSDLSEAVDTAKMKSDKEENAFSFAFIDRVNGVSEFYAATKLGEGKKFGYEALFNDGVMVLIKEKIYGSKSINSVTSFGTTFFSAIYLVGGGMLLVLFGFVAGWIIRWSLMFIKMNIFKSNFTFQAYLPILCILWVKLLSSGGNMTLPMKELFLVVLCLFLLERYATTDKTHGTKSL